MGKVGKPLFPPSKVRNSLIKQWIGGANSVWGKQSPATLCLNLSVVGGLILIMEKSGVFSATCLKPLILAYFRASEECLTILFVKKCEKALIYKGFRAPAT